MSARESVPPRSQTKSATALADLAAVEGLRRPRRRSARAPLARSGKRNVSPSPQDPALPARRAPALLGSAGVDRRQDLEDVGLLAVDRGALAGVADRRRRPAPPAASSRSAPAPAARPAAVPGTPQEAAPTLKTCGVRRRSGRRPGPAPRRARLPRGPGRRRRSRSATVSPRRRVDEHEAAGAEAGQRALDRERGEHRADRGVDRVAALAQDLGAGLRGQRMPGGDDALSLGALR